MQTMCIFSGSVPLNQECVTSCTISHALSSFLTSTLNRAYLVQDHTRRLILHTVCDCTFCETPNISLLWSEIFKIALKLNFVGKDEDILFSLLPLSEFVSEAPPVDKSLD